MSKFKVGDVVRVRESCMDSLVVEFSNGDFDLTQDFTISQIDYNSAKEIQYNVDTSYSKFMYFYEKEIEHVKGQIRLPFKGV